MPIVMFDEATETTTVITNAEVGNVERDSPDAVTVYFAKDDKGRTFYICLSQAEWAKIEKPVDVG